MRKINWLLILIVAVGGHFLNMYNQIQISEKQFFNDFLSNTTHIDVYNQKTASLFFDNKTKITHFIQLKNVTDFENQLSNHNYQYEILYKTAYGWKDG